MFRKNKLDKLIEKQDVKQDIDYEVLASVKEKVYSADFDGNGVIHTNRKKTIILLSCIAVLIVLTIGLLVGFLTPKKSEPIYYSYTENNRYLYNSMENYCQDKKIALSYFTGLPNTYEVVRVYFDDKKQDVLICQDIVLQDTYETILLWVELKDNYIFEFLKMNDIANDLTTINNVQVKYSTKYINETYSYLTYIKYEYKSRTYWLTTDLVEEFAWQDYVKQLIV